MLKCTVTSLKNENLTFLSCSLSKSLNLKVNDAAKTTWQNFMLFIHIKEKFFYEKMRARGNEGTTHINTSSYLHQFLYRLVTPLTAEQRSSTASHLPENMVAHPTPPTSAEPEANTSKLEAYQPLPPAHSTRTIPQGVFCHIDSSINVC